MEKNVRRDKKKHGIHGNIMNREMHRLKWWIFQPGMLARCWQLKYFYIFFMFTPYYVGKMNPIWLYNIFSDGLKSTTNVRWVFRSVSCLLLTWWPDAPLHWNCPSLQPWSILRMTKNMFWTFTGFKKKRKWNHQELQKLIGKTCIYIYIEREIIFIDKINTQDSTCQVLVFMF